MIILVDISPPFNYEVNTFNTIVMVTGFLFMLKLLILLFIGTDCTNFVS